MFSVSYETFKAYAIYKNQRPEKVNKSNIVCTLLLVLRYCLVTLKRKSVFCYVKTAKLSKFTLTGVKSFLGDACENGQGDFRSKTVGFFRDRYRLGHKWVPEMVLDVQSNLPNTFIRVKQGY